MKSPSEAFCPRCGANLRGVTDGVCPRCVMAQVMQATEVHEFAASVPAPSLEELAPHFPQLEILECLGRGGMGIVYQARQKSLHRLVALKLLAPERGGDTAFAERFAREARALAALNHPHIVTVHDFGEAGGFYYLLMEFVDGVNLRQAMGSRRLTPEQALAIVPPVCEALQYAHDQGIVHRDIKPENLLMDKSGRVKIADFGIAKMLGDDSNVGLADSQPAGTPQYMAPEQRELRHTDHRADIYSLGVVLYEMLTGELPAGKWQPPSCKVQMDVRLDEIVLRALEQTPELRYQTAAELRTQVQALSDIQRALTSRSKAGTGAPRFPRIALVGAASVILFFLVVPAFIAHEIQAQEFWRHGPFISVLSATVFFVFILPGFAAPFVATLLGWIAVSQIRRSAGRLQGLWLALFDGLLFPLLALDVFLFRLIIDIAISNQLWTLDLNDIYNHHLPAQISVRLRYTLGPLENISILPMRPHTSNSLGLIGGGQLNGVGQDVDGRAFVSLAVDAAKLKDGRFGVFAMTKSGTELPSLGHSESGGARDAGIRVEQFPFSIPLEEVAQFRIGTRPIRSVTWPDIKLPPASPASGTNR